MDPKQLIRDICDMIDTRDFSRLDELIHEDYVDHGGIEREGRGREAFRENTRQSMEALSESHIDVDMLIVEGDMGAWRSVFTGVHTGNPMGLPPTGRRVSIEQLDSGRMKGGKALEQWGQVDVAALMA